MQKRLLQWCEVSAVETASAIHVVGKEEVLPRYVASDPRSYKRVHEGDTEPEGKGRVLLPHSLPAGYLLDPYPLR